MNWSWSALGQKVHDERKHELVQSLFPGRWGSHTSYEHTNTFYKDSTAIILDDGRSAWDHLAERVNKEVNLANMDHNSHERIFAVMAHVTRQFKNQAKDKIVDV
eukprot:3115058-Pyramimonas_sp.AAC.1